MAEFIEELFDDEWEVETPTGWQSFSGIGKTIEYDEWEIKTENHSIICADEHLIKSGNKFINAYELSIGDYIETKLGLEQVISVTKLNKSSQMFDLLDVENGNEYYTNGIVSHNSTTIVSYLLHYALFNEQVNIAILANKGSTAREILDRWKTSYENLPKWLQQGVVVWNKGNIELENGSKVMAASTSSSAVRGSSFNIIFMDEFAHIDPPDLAEEFFTSVYPTISSGKTTKVFIVSTPKGLNMFYKMWVDAEEGRSGYVPVDVHWSQVPGRDEKWKEETIRNTSERQFSQEYECVSGDTIVTVKNKETNEIQEMKIEDLMSVNL